MPGKYVKGSRLARGLRTCDYDSPVSSGPVRHRTLRPTFTAIVIRAFCLPRPRRLAAFAAGGRTDRRIN